MPKKVDFLQSKTRTNLARAFSGECQDGARYQFMAKQAEEQTAPQQTETPAPQETTPSQEEENQDNNKNH